jgi:putative ABC transport system substrate-binding protein
MERTGQGRMRRRELLLATTAAALASAAPRWHPAFAQAPRVARLGVLIGGVPDPGPFLRFFREGLQAHGYVEGKNIVLELRSAEGRAERLPALAAELVRLKPDLIVCYQTPTVRAAKEATREIPIVMASAGDPVATGLVASLARPGGNITGMGTATAEAAGKCLQLIRDVLPTTRRVSALVNGSDPLFAKAFFERIETAGAALGVDVRRTLAESPQHLEAAFAILAKDPVDALISQPSLGTKRVADIALTQRLPAVSPNRPFALAGGLMSYSANQAQMFREAAIFVDKILKGAKPADLPVQQPTTFDFVVNLKTASALGITVPPALLFSADEVIE